MKEHAKVLLTAAALICLVPAAVFADIAPYSQDFESMDPASLTVLGDDGWLVYGNVFSGVDGTYMYGYGPYPAPNNPAAPAFSTIAVGEGGVDQGDNQLSIFSDYENADHANGNLIESNVYREQVIGLGDVGKTWIFSFQAKKGDLAAPSTANAFIKTLDPLSGYATTNLVTEDMTAIPTEWGGWSLHLTIDAGLIGQLFQIGFSNSATNYDPSSIIYDNVMLSEAVSGVPDATVAAGASLRQNYPNPFNPLTRIDFALEEPGMADVSVYDLAGRLVATLHHGDLGAGEHHVMWDGRTDAGAAAAAGQYRYVLTTAAGKVSRSMILLK